MQFTNELNWQVGDFAIAGGLFFGLGVLLEVIVKKVKKKSLRIALCIALLLLLFLIWAELAVGVFGSIISGD